MRYLLTALLMLSLNLALQGQEKLVDKVVATVGSELVLLSEVEEQRSLILSRKGNLPENARCGILEQLLSNKLLVNQAKLDSVEVSETEVQTQLDARIERILGFMNNDISQFEAYYGQTVSEVKEQFRQDLRNQLLQERMRSQILQDVRVTPSEVKEFYANIPQDSLPYFNAEVEVGEIVVRPTISEEQKQKVLSQLQDIREQLEAGEATFEDMAAKYSDDGSARQGGDLGWTTRGKFVPAFEAAAYKLDDNEISSVVETQFGYHIIKMIGRRGNSIRVRHILLQPELQEQDIEDARLYLDSIRQVIIKDSIPFSAAVKEFSDENQQSYNNDGRMINPLTGNTFYEVGDLDADVYFAIDTMDVGDISKAFEFRDQRGEVYLRIVQLQSRTKPHTANLQEDYTKIRQAAIESKRNQFINEWIQDKIGRTFINVAGRYQACPNLQEWQGKDGIVRP